MRQTFEPFRSITLGDISRQQMRSYPAHLAVVCEASRFTYSELDGRVNRLSNVFREQGVRCGDRVVWLGQNCHRLLEALLAAAKLGAVLCPVNWRMTPAEIKEVLDDGESPVVLWQGEEIGEKVARARALSESSGSWIQHDGRGPSSYEGLVEAASAEDEEDQVDSNSPVVQLYTAGFGGTPSGALLTQIGIIIYDLVFAAAFGIDSAYRYLNCGALYHMATLQSMLATFHFAGTNVFIRRPDPLRICELIEREQINGAYIVEPTISQIVKLNRDGTYDLKTLHGRPGRPEWNAMINVESDPATARTGYGQTEVSGRLTWVQGGEQGAHGRPHAAALVRLLDDAGQEVPPGAVGEICARGPVVMAGYSHRQDENSRRIDQGWYRTNDLGRRETDGSLTFLGSKGRLIKSGVENVYPPEVEASLARHPGIAECAVIGVPDPTWGQSVKAIVVLKPQTAVPADDLIAFCRSELASYKCPRYVEFTTELPRVRSLIDYAALDERYGGGGYPGSETYRKNAGF